jgi:hypothetical protein
MKLNKQFNTIDQLWQYILKSNLEAYERIWDKVKLRHHISKDYIETVTVNF